MILGIIKTNDSCFWCFPDNNLPQRQWHQPSAGTTACHASWRGDLFERLAYGDPLGESEKKRYVNDILEGALWLCGDSWQPVAPRWSVTDSSLKWSSKLLILWWLLGTVLALLLCIGLSILLIANCFFLNSLFLKWHLIQMVNSNPPQSPERDGAAPCVEKLWMGRSASPQHRCASWCSWGESFAPSQYRPSRSFTRKRPGSNRPAKRWRHRWRAQQSWDSSNASLPRPFAKVRMQVKWSWVVWNCFVSVVVHVGLDLWCKHLCFFHWPEDRRDVCEKCKNLDGFTQHLHL